MSDFILIPDEYETDLIAALACAALHYSDPRRIVSMLFCVNPDAAESLEASLAAASASRTEEPA